MTVKELKLLIQDWPEEGRDGDPTEVWITTGENLSSPCVSSDRLNVRTDESGTVSYDLLLTPSNFQ